MPVLCAGVSAESSKEDAGRHQQRGPQQLCAQDDRAAAQERSVPGAWRHGEAGVGGRASRRWEGASRRWGGAAGAAGVLPLLSSVSLVGVLLVESALRMNCWTGKMAVSDL